jgi:Sec-independent protein translocase protein TatA
MAEKQLRSRSHSVAREVDRASLEPERDAARIEVDEEPNRVTDRQWEGLAESGNNVMSASQFREFMSAMTKGFGELRESIKSVAHEMSSKIEVTNKDLSDSLTKQFRRKVKILKEKFLANLSLRM